MLWIKFDGERVRVDDISEGGYLPLLSLSDGTEWYVASDSDAAGRAAREYWRDMAESDPSEFRAIVGDECLISWCLGQPAGPGSAQVRSLKEWLDVCADHPEEEFASWDGEEVEPESVSRELSDSLGFVPTVAYRHN